MHFVANYGEYGVGWSNLGFGLVELMVELRSRSLSGQDKFDHKFDKFEHNFDKFDGLL